MGRIERINQLMKREISLIIQQEIKDPRLQFVTITNVDVSRDLQHARVYFSVLGNGKKSREAQEGLTSARGFVRKVVGGRVDMRYTPEIDFIYDESIEYAARINEAIEKVRLESKDD